MKYSHIIKSMLFVLIGVCSIIRRTHTMMPKLLAALAGDVCLTAVASSLVENNDTLLTKTSPSVQDQIRRDAKRIAPYTLFLLPGGIILSAGARVSMVAGTAGIVKKAFALPLACLSIPVNYGLVAAGYTLRAQSPEENKESIQKVKDLIKDSL